MIGVKTLDSVLQDFKQEVNPNRQQKEALLVACDSALKHNKSTKKFEAKMKDKPQEEKCRLVYLWTKKILEIWD